MVKKLFLLIALSLVVFADNAYERNCVPCHRNLPTDLQGMFKNYLAKRRSRQRCATICVIPPNISR